MSGSVEALDARAQRVLMGNYGKASVALVRGQGSSVWDADGREFVDLVAGIAVCALGHSHPRIAAAVAGQLGQVGHVSNLFLTEPAVELAERLLALAGGAGRVFFANSGAEANEAALKLARRRGSSIAAGKTEIVAAEGSFHGRTLGALSITGQPAKRAGFGPLPGDVTFVPYGDIAALRAAVGPRTAAVILEPIQGEGGVVVAPAGYLGMAREVTSEHDALLVVDEVQTGVGRTGAWFGFQHDAVRPDVITMAKGLGGGLPISACIGLDAAGDVFGPGDHGTTFGGNPVVCAAALAVLDVVAEEQLVERASALGHRLQRDVAGLAHPLVRGVRGRGLLFGIELAEPVAKAVEAGCRDAGFLVNAVTSDVVRVVPPLIVPDADLSRFVAALPAVLDLTRRAAAGATGGR